MSKRLTFTALALLMLALAGCGGHKSSSSQLKQAPQEAPSGPGTQEHRNPPLFRQPVNLPTAVG